MANEKRPIYLEDAKAALLGWDTDPTDEEIEYTLDKLPEVDAVEVVRCKDCKHWKNASKPLYCSEFMGDCNVDDEPVNRWEYDFCSYGEKMDSEK